MTVDANPLVTGVLGNPLHLEERTANPATRADTGFVYTKEVATITELFYKDSAGNVLQLTSGGTLSGGGDTTAQYLTLATSATLTNERVFTAGTGISVTDAGAGSTYTVAVNQAFAPTWTGVHTFTEATSPIITAKLGPAAGQQHTLPAVASDTLALLAATQTLTNKTLTNPIIATIIGGTGAGDDITLRATSHATDGDIIFQTDSTNEVARFTASEVVFNDAGANQDFRVEGDSEPNLIFVDASSDNVCIGTATPAARLTVEKTYDGPALGQMANTNGGTSVQADWRGYNGTTVAAFGITGTGYSADPALAANEAYMLCSSLGAGIAILSNVNSGYVRIRQRNGAGTLLDTFKITSTTATFATDRFIVDPTTNYMDWKGADAANVQLRHSAHGTGVNSNFICKRSRGTAATPTAVASGDRLAAFSTHGYANGDYQAPASMVIDVDAAVSGSSVPTAFVWLTTNAATTLFEAMRLDSDARLSLKAGNAADTIRVGGIMLVNTTSAANVGAGEDDLITYNVPAATLNTNGDSIWFEACGTFAATANNKRVRVRFGTGGTNLILDTGALVTAVATDWLVRGRVVRTGAATQKGYAEFQSGGTVLAAFADIETGLDQTLSGSVVIKLTGEATSDNDIVQQSMIVGWDPNNT